VIRSDDHRAALGQMFRADHLHRDQCTVDRTEHGVDVPIEPIILVFGNIGPHTATR
jgi:hypothetical protein